MSEQSFDFEVGDRVKVTAKEGDDRVELTAECRKIETFPTGRTQATFALPGLMNNASFATYEADFEVIGDE